MVRQYLPTYGKTPKERRQITMHRWFENHKERETQKHRQYLVDLKLNVLSHYSLRGEPECARCGISDTDVLQIDHVENNGAEHRREIGHGTNFYIWLRNEHRNGFQVLCANCNLKKKLEYQRR